MSVWTEVHVQQSEGEMGSDCEYQCQYSCSVGHLASDPEFGGWMIWYATLLHYCSSDMTISLLHWFTCTRTRCEVDDA